MFISILVLDETNHLASHDSPGLCDVWPKIKSFLSSINQSNRDKNQLFKSLIAINSELLNLSYRLNLGQDLLSKLNTKGERMNCLTGLITSQLTCMLKFCFLAWTTEYIWSITLASSLPIPFRSLSLFSYFYTVNGLEQRNSFVTGK